MREGTEINPIGCMLSIWYTAQTVGTQIRSLGQQTYPTCYLGLVLFGRFGGGV